MIGAKATTWNQGFGSAMPDAERWDKFGIDGDEPITDGMLEWVSNRAPVVVRPGLVFDGSVGIIRGYRFITVMPSKWAVNKPRKAITRKAARKMRRKWHV